MTERLRRVLAIASGGGHWAQLLRLRQVLEQFDTAFVTVVPEYSAEVSAFRFYSVPDASRARPFGFLSIAVRAAFILAKERPDCIVTTGSAPMLIFISIGRVLGVQSLWIDSIANADRLSTSGRLARRLANICISQWPDVAEQERVPFWGSVV